MRNNKNILLVLALLSATSIAVAQDSAPKATTSTNVASTTKTNGVAKTSVKQADVASKTAKFNTVLKTDDGYKTALDAHDLATAEKQVNKEGSIKGTVAKLYEPRSGNMAIINFDADYKSAMTAMVSKKDFSQFPVLTNLTGKEVVITGKFIDYQGHAEIVLTNAAQIKLVE